MTNKINSTGLSERLPVGTKIEMTDKHGYYVMNGCGTIVYYYDNGNHFGVINHKKEHFSSVSLIGKFVEAV